MGRRKNPNKVNTTTGKFIINFIKNVDAVVDHSEWSDYDGEYESEVEGNIEQISESLKNINYVDEVKFEQISQPSQNIMVILFCVTFLVLGIK